VAAAATETAAAEAASNALIALSPLKESHFEKKKKLSMIIFNALNSPVPTNPIDDPYVYLCDPPRPRRRRRGGACCVSGAAPTAHPFALPMPDCQCMMFIHHIPSFKHE